MSDTAKQKKTIGCVVIGLIAAPVGLAFLGIFAAVAVPAFLKFQRKAKSAEGVQVVTQTGAMIVSYYAEHCKFPSDGLPTMAVLPTGGNKAKASYSGGWDDIKIKSGDRLEQYFQYQFVTVDGDIRIWGEHDFYGDGEPNHVVEQWVKRVPGKKCQVESIRLETLNEFQ